jgi:hypothetical protein
MATKSVATAENKEGPSSGMAQDSAATRRHGDGGIGEIIFCRSRSESVAGFLSGVVSGSGSAFSVMDIWGMRDDACPATIKNDPRRQLEMTPDDN